MAYTKMKNTYFFLQKDLGFSECQLLLNNIKVFLLLQFACKLYLHLYMQILFAPKGPFHSSALLTLG